jgi:2-polyprenyl-6-methoxyphenol hydroxylase-like FAD-dependent oxidoreductase
MGMGDVKALTDILKEAVRSGQDFGDLSVLRKYNQDRMLKNAGMQMTVDGIGKLFKSDLYPLQQLRSLGLDMLNDVPLIKVSHGQ